MPSLKMALSLLLAIAFIGQNAHSLAHGEEKREADAARTFGHTFAHWCRQILDKSGSWNQLLPLFETPKVFNEVPAALSDKVGNGVRRALDALYTIRDRQLTDENMRALVAKWTVVDATKVYDDEDEQMDRKKRDVKSMRNANVDPFDLVQQLGEQAELARLAQRKRKQGKLAVPVKNGSGIAAQFPFNPFPGQYENGGWERDLDGNELSGQDAKEQLKIFLEAVADFLTDQAGKLPKVDFEEIVEQKGLISEKEGKKLRAGKKPKGLADPELLKTQFLSKLNPKGGANLKPQGKRDLPPSSEENEREEKPSLAKQKPVLKEEALGNEAMEKCAWIIQVLRGQEYNQLELMEGQFCRKFSGKKFYRTAEHVFGNILGANGKDKAGKNGNGNGRNSKRRHNTGRGRQNAG